MIPLGLRCIGPLSRRLWNSCGRFPAKELAELAEAAGVPRADVSAAMKHKNQGKVLTAIVEQRKRKKKEVLVEPLPERGAAGGGE